MNAKRLLGLLIALMLLCTSALAAAESTDRVLTVNLESATDEELAAAAAQIKAEQQARMKTTIQLDPAEITLLKGGTQKVNATMIGLPDGVTAGKTVWSSSDESVATCSNGTVKGMGGGSAVITCTVPLSDGSEVTAQLPVTGILPVQSIKAASKLEVMAGDEFTVDYTITPADATNQEVVWSSSDEKVVKPGENGKMTAGLSGKATVTVSATDGSGKSAKINVTVGKRIGRYDDELTFQGIAWGQDDKAVIMQLEEAGLVQKDSGMSAYNTGSIYFWPRDDRLFADWSSWRKLPVAFEDHRLGAAQMYLGTPEKKIGGYAPQSLGFFFLNPINEKGEIDPEKTELVGVYAYYDNEHEPGTEIFLSLLDKMEAQYGEFTRYLSKDLTRSYYKDTYQPIKDAMAGAKMFRYRDFRKEDPDLWLSSEAICTLRGKNNTGIMLKIDSNACVTLYFGKTDTLDRIKELQTILEALPDDKEDAGI